VTIAPARALPRTALATALALTAALIWASWYFVTLHLQHDGVGVAPIVAYPFLAGGIGYGALTAAQGRIAAVGVVARQPAAYGRAAILAGMQLTVVAGTYTVGAVDTSLLTLVADTVLTPILVLSIFAEGRERLRSAAFLVGVAGCVVGATLAILAGSAAAAVGGWDWAVVAVLPVLIAVYFLWVARAGRTSATEPLVTHASIVAALLTVLVAPFLPGGLEALAHLAPIDLLLLTVNGLLSFTVGPWLYFRAIRTVGMILPAVLMSTIPVFTILLGLLLDRSIPPMLALVGIPIAVLGAFLAFLGERQLEGPPLADAA
jgi:drug/metabolite transporter (DMT)-like permease